MRSGRTARNFGLLLIPVMSAVSGCAGVIVAGGTLREYAHEVPPSHLPPPGECRIWYPELPPGQQPPPGNCYDLQHRVPRDAYLVYGK